MNENYYGFIDEVKAINILKEHKGKLIVAEINLESGKSNTKRLSIEEGMEVIRAVQSIVWDNDELIPHLSLYTTRQDDITHIVPNCVMFDILL